MLRSRVAVLKTIPATVIDDYKRLMRLADYQQFLPRDKETAFKINISWHYFYPACSTTPWQLDGVIATLLEDGYSKEKLYGCHNRSVVVSARRGELANKHKQVVEGKYGLRNIHLYEKGEEWIQYTPQAKMRVLDKIYPEGIRIPKRLVGSNVIHLPTMKTHVFTQITGAMKNAFGGLLFEKRHWTHSVIHETLVDLLAIQREIHPGIFAVMDGTFAGDGPGPRCMVPHVKNYILASGDDRIVEAARRLFFTQGYEFTDLAQIRNVARVSSGSLHYFFPHKEDLLVAVLEKHKLLWGPQFLEPAYEETSDPIERIFAILNGYRDLLGASEFFSGCLIGNLALEVCNNHPKFRDPIVENFQVWCGTVEALIKEASERLPAETKPASLAHHIQATMEGGIMLARAYRDLEPFDQAVNHLTDYFDRLQQDRAESDSDVEGDGKVKRKARVPRPRPMCQNGL